MKAIIRRSDGTLEITAGQAYAAGDVIVSGDILAVTPRPIANGETASLAIEGVFTMPKEGAVSAKAMGVGKRVYWDADNGVVVLAANATVGMKFLGYTTAAALTAATTVEVVLAPDGTSTAALIAAAGTAGGTYAAGEVNAIGTCVNAILAALKAEGRIASS